MSNFVGLCTFCEYHGPSVVILTQSQDFSQSSTENLTNKTKDQSCTSNNKSFQEQLSKTDSLQNVLKRRFSVQQQHASSDKSSCSYCSSLKSGSQVLTSDGPAHFSSYISTQDGVGDIYNLAKDASIKSISCEVVENRVGKIVFTNSPSAATVLAQTFRLPDKNARGFHRYFSIVVATRLRGHMVRCWPGLAQMVEEVILLLESKCGHPLTVKDVKELSKSKLSPTTQSTNNLKQLTYDESIFLRLHTKFCSLLTHLESVKTENVVIGCPVQCTLTFNESRILLLVNILSSLSRTQCGVLLHNLLSGKGLEVRSPDRESGRIVADALAALLPNNKQHESVYFANVILSPLEGDCSNIELVSHSLIVKDGNLKMFSFIDDKCGCTVKQECDDVMMCRWCHLTTSSTIVIKLVHLLHSAKLHSTVLHTKLLTTVEATLNQAKVWSKLKSQFEETSCLKRFGFCESDASILNFFKLFVR